MPPAEFHQQNAYFVCAERNGVITPVGTAFLVSVEAEGGTVRYFVTANHVVRDGMDRWIRLRRRDGGEPYDHKIQRQWVPHETADIAALPCDLDLEPYLAGAMEDQYFADVWPSETPLNYGAPAYFVGLLTDVPTMADRAVPMVRAGAVGALSVEDVPVRDLRPDRTVYTRLEPRAHLLDTYSRSGFSGSPAYVEFPYLRIHEFSLPTAGPGSGRFVSDVTSHVALLGVLVGHFGSPGDNSGVAIVVPVEAIRELLDDERLARGE